MEIDLKTNLLIPELYLIPVTTHTPIRLTKTCIPIAGRVFTDQETRSLMVKCHMAVFHILVPI